MTRACTMSSHELSAFGILSLAASLLAALASPVGAQTGRDDADAPPQVGPTNGTLLLAGGGVRDPAIIERFLDLAGGSSAPIVVIPTASGAESYGPFARAARTFLDLGATRVTVLHTNDRSEADSPDFVQPIRQARGVWFSGGRQWRLADSYLATATQAALDDLLARGGVIGGSSAGATIQGSYLARGDSKTNTIMMGDHEEGFAFLRGVAVDQHLLRRNRHFDLLEIVRARPELLGIGLDEDTAIVVVRDRFEVIGNGYVGIYDHQRSIDTGGSFYFLAPGDRFDLASRQPLRVERGEAPLERVVERAWPETETEP